MRLTGERLHMGGERRANNPWRILLLLSIMGGGVLLTRAVWVTKSVQPLFLATPTATRTSASHAEEGRTQFSAGRLQAAIDAYQSAAAVSPQEARLWAELARAQAYSSAFMTSAVGRN